MPNAAARAAIHTPDRLGRDSFSISDLSEEFGVTARALRFYEDEGLIANARVMGQYVTEQVALLAQKHPSIGDFRNTGLLGCLELVKNRLTKEPLAPFNAKPGEMAIMNKVAAKIKELGMYTFVRWNYVFIAPPLCITQEQVDEGLAILSQALAIADEYVEEGPFIRPDSSLNNSTI